MPDRVRGAALFADISGFTPLTEALAKELGPQRGGGGADRPAEPRLPRAHRGSRALRRPRHLLQRRRDHLLDRRRRRPARHGLRARDAGDDGTVRGRGDARRHEGAARDEGRRLRRGGAALSGRRPGRAADRRAGGASHRRAGGRRAPGGEGRGRARPVGAGIAGRPRRDPRNARRGRRLARVRCRREADRAGRGGAGARAGQTRCRRPSPRSGCCRTSSSDCVPGTASSWPSCVRRTRSFVRFGGIDYDDDDDAVDKLDGFVRAVQRILASYGGNLLHLALGDKGAYLYAVFGSPRAHEDDAARAAAAALELRALQATTAARNIQIGITYGRLRSGTYGHKDRQTFTCIGDAVNLAARLMAKAPPGRIYVAEDVRRAAGDVFTWQQLSAVGLEGQGRAASRCSSLTGSKRHAFRGRADYELPLVGREAELDVLGAKLDEALAGRGQIVGISAEAGMGKSRLVAEFARKASERGAVVAVGECQSYGTNTSYFVWREVWSTLFRLDAEPARARSRCTRSRRSSPRSIPALVPRAPLLAALLDLPIPDNELTAPVRREAAQDLARRAARRMPPGAGGRGAASCSCSRIATGSTRCRAICSRCSPARWRASACSSCSPTVRARTSTASSASEASPHFTEIALAELDDEAAAQLIRSTLSRTAPEGSERSCRARGARHRQGAGQPVLHRGAAQLHPEPGRRSAERGGAQESPAAREPAQPDPEPHRHARRVAAAHAQGGERASAACFARRCCRASTRSSAESPRWASTCGRSCEADLVNVDQEAEQTYLFKHVVTQEVAYESMPFAFRSMLHERCGRYIETSEAEAIERNLDLLAHHYWHSENLPKKREYLGRAGDAAQAAYANAAAIDYFERLVPLVEQGARVDVLLKLGKVLELVGNWHRAEQVESEALALAEGLGDDRSRASCETALAEVARKQGRYDEAVERLDRAARGFGYARRRDRASAGCCTSPAPWRRSAATMRRRSRTTRRASRFANGPATRRAWASLLSNLGIVAEYRGDYERARALHERALALRTEIGDRWAIGNSTNCLGMIAVLQKRYAEARDWFQKSMLLNREVGDAWMVAICHNNLGNATRGLGDYDGGPPALRRQPARLSRLRRPVGARVPARGHRHPRRARRRRAIGARVDGRRRRVARGDRRAARPVARGGDQGADGAGGGHALRSTIGSPAASEGARSTSPPPSTAPSRSASGAERRRRAGANGP